MASSYSSSSSSVDHDTHIRCSVHSLSAETTGKCPAPKATVKIVAERSYCWRSRSAGDRLRNSFSDEREFGFDLWAFLFPESLDRAVGEMLAGAGMEGEFQSLHRSLASSLLEKSIHAGRRCEGLRAVVVIRKEVVIEFDEPGAGARSSSQDADCAVCLESLAEGDGTEPTSCGHVFHQLCLLQWMEVQRSCPLCRSRIN